MTREEMVLGVKRPGLKTEVKGLGGNNLGGNVFWEMFCYRKLGSSINGLVTDRNTKVYC